MSCGNGTRSSYRNCTSSQLSASATCNGSSINIISCYAGPCPSMLLNYCVKK